MRQACLCLDPPRLSELPHHGATAALNRVLFLNRALTRAWRLFDGDPAKTARPAALSTALRRAKQVYLRRVKRFGVAS